MSKEVKEEVLALLIVIVGLYFTANSTMIFVGLINGLYESKGCKDPLARIEYLMPGHELGCWLGGTP